LYVRTSNCSRDFLSTWGERLTVNFLDARRQGNGAANERAGAARGVRNVAGRLIEDAMIERLEANADVVGIHFPLTDAKEPGPVAGPLAVLVSEEGALLSETGR
jgi:hypothetical protein